MRLFILIAFLALAGRLVQVQAFSGTTYSSYFSSTHTVVNPVVAIRGGIYDRDGAVFAMSVPRDAIVCDPMVVTAPVKEADRLSPLLHVAVPKLVSEMTEKGTGFVYLAKLVDTSTAEQINNLNLAGINLEPESERLDPSGQLATSVIGTVGGLQTGQSGLEYEYNSLLSGKDGTLSDEVNGSDIAFPNVAVTGSAGSNGDGIETTLDEPLQYVAEQSLKAALLSSHAVSGTVIVMNVHTGDILAMANLVANQKTHVVTESPENLALQAVYEPGSVFKLVTFSAALQAGVINPNTVLTIPPDMVIDGSVFHDAEDHPTEKLTATQVLAQSSNLGTIQIAERLGSSTIFDQMKKLGIGKVTGLNFPGETKGIVEPLEDWGPTDLASTAIGQNTSVTPMQVLDMMNTVATGGVFVPPRLVQGVVLPDGSVREIRLPVEHRELSKSVTSELTGMLEQVVTDGTAPAAAIPGYTVAGKTGTAQIPNLKSGGYLDNAYMATFTGFAPAQNPELSAIVVLNRPTPIFGGTVAAPVFSQVMGYALQRYGIAPSESTKQDSGATAVNTYASVTAGQPTTTTTPEEATKAADDVTGSTSRGTASTNRNGDTTSGTTASGDGQAGTIPQSAGQSARSP